MYRYLGSTLAVACFVGALPMHPTAAFGQGTVLLSNLSSPNVNAPIFDIDGTTRLSGAGFMAQLYAAASSQGRLVPALPPTHFLEGTAAGYLFPLVATASNVVAGA